MTAIARVPLAISDVVAPMKSWPSRLAVEPVRTEAATKTMPTPPMMAVRMVCRRAAVLAPMMLMAVMATAMMTAAASQDA